MSKMRDILETSFRDKISYELRMIDDWFVSSCYNKMLFNDGGFIDGIYIVKNEFDDYTKLIWTEYFM